MFLALESQPYLGSVFYPYILEVSVNDPSSYVLDNHGDSVSPLSRVPTFPLWMAFPWLIHAGY